MDEWIDEKVRIDNNRAYLGFNDSWLFVGHLSDDGLSFRAPAAEHRWSFVMGDASGEWVDILRLCQRCGFRDDVRQVLLHPSDANDARVADWRARMFTVAVDRAGRPGHALVLGVVPTLAPCLQ
jgi:hypothetical protein